MELQNTVVVLLKKNKQTNKQTSNWFENMTFLYLISKAYLRLCQPTQGFPKATNGPIH